MVEFRRSGLQGLQKIDSFCGAKRAERRCHQGKRARIEKGGGAGEWARAGPGSHLDAAIHFDFIDGLDSHTEILFKKVGIDLRTEIGRAHV